MTADALIADLDAALKDAGEDIRLQRLTLGPGGTQIPVEVVCRATVRGYAPHELVGGIAQQDVKLILSPSEITRAAWPGGTPMPNRPDPRVPLKGDRVITGRGTLAVQAASGIFIGSTLVRIEIQARGQG